MKKEFCTYKQSLALKELGFKEECFGYYDKDGDFYTVAVGKLLSAPLKQQAFRFFRERHDMHHGIGFTGSWYYDIDSMKNTENAVYEVAHKWNMKTYEEAESACLDKLIKIVKNKDDE